MEVWDRTWSCERPLIFFLKRLKSVNSSCSEQLFTHVDQCVEISNKFTHQQTNDTNSVLGEDKGATRSGHRTPLGHRTQNPSGHPQCRLRPRDDLAPNPKWLMNKKELTLQKKTLRNLIAMASNLLAMAYDGLQQKVM